MPDYTIRYEVKYDGGTWAQESMRVSTADRDLPTTRQAMWEVRRHHGVVSGQGGAVHKTGIRIRKVRVEAA